MVGFTYSGKDIARERRTTIEQCAKIAEAHASNTADGEGEIYIARKIADEIRALNKTSEDSVNRTTVPASTPVRSS